MDGCTYGDEELSEDERRWKESGERGIVARNDVGGQSVQ